MVEKYKREYNSERRRKHEYRDYDPKNGDSRIRENITPRGDGNKLNLVYQ